MNEETTYDGLFVNISIFNDLPFDLKRIIARFYISPELIQMKEKLYFPRWLSPPDKEKIRGENNEKYHRRLCYANQWSNNDKFYEGLTYPRSTYDAYYRYLELYQKVCYEERLLNKRFDFFIRQNCFHICKDEEMVILKKYLDENKIPHFKSWRIKRFWKACMSF
jgi:hypothetical protein